MRFPYRLFGACTLFLGIIYYIVHTRLPIHTIRNPFQNHEYNPIPSNLQITTVIASQKSIDTSWLQDFFPNWTHEIYITDDRNAHPKTPQNKGRESMVYLSYIIDKYSALPDIVVFLHAQRYQWHNDDPLYDNARALSRLQIPYILRHGYANLRCAWRPGCPSEIRPLEAASSMQLSDEFGPRTGPFFASAFGELFPGVEIPGDVGLGCCAQFVVSGEKIRERKREEYEGFRMWLLETDFDDAVSGRIFEYLWHIIFGQKAVYCPVAKDCYCNVYGLCDLKCDEAGACHSHPFPKYKDIPDGWPWYGWEGEWQNATEM